MIRQHHHYGRVLGALVLGPLAVAVFAGAQLHPYGRTAEAVGAYVTFLTAQAAVLAWSSYRLRRARRRLAAFRASHPRR
jgi:hypothetical protein